MKLGFVSVCVLCLRWRGCKLLMTLHRVEGGMVGLMSGMQLPAAKVDFIYRSISLFGRKEAIFLVHVYSILSF